jgi:hypothetical protein
LAKTKEWLKQHMHWRRQDQQKQLTMLLTQHEVERQWARTLRRRSQRQRLYWCYLKSQPWFQLPYAVSTLHPTV